MKPTWKPTNNGSKRNEDEYREKCAIQALHALIVRGEESISYAEDAFEYADSMAMERRGWSDDWKHIDDDDY